jgi:DMSO reductase family type II enzyme heme b subunit
VIPLDRHAAVRATAVALVVALGVSAAQVGVAAVATSGHQPMAMTDTVPHQTDAAAWEEAPSRTVSLNEQQMAPPHGGGSVDEMTVQALTNESHVAFKLSWEDPTNDTSLAEPGNYSDAAAIMLHTGEQPPITMGAAGTPVNIWYWRANWQFGAQTDTGSWTGDMYTYPHPANETKPAEAAGNPLAKSEYDRYAQNYYAKGYGSTSHAPAQNVDARGQRTDDGWEVVFVRERSTDGEYDATVTDERVYLAFAAWNGSADEVNGQKSITLQFSTLDPDADDLAAASGGGSSGGDGGGSADTGGGASTAAADTATSGDGAFISESFRNGLAAVLVATLLAWAVAYRSIRRNL